MMKCEGFVCKSRCRKKEDGITFHNKYQNSLLLLVLIENHKKVPELLYKVEYDETPPKLISPK